jgi:hypothetical protein
MSMLIKRAAFILLGLCQLLGATAQAASIGSVIPSKSYGAVVVTDPAKLNGKISSLMQALQLPVPELLPLVKFQLGFNNGFDDKRPALLVLYPGKNQPVIPVFLVPTTKYADFQINFDKREAHAALKGYELVKSNVGEMLLAARGEFAVLIPKEFEGELDDFILDNTNLGEELTKSEDWIAEHDATFVASKKGIRAAMKFMRLQFAQVKAQLGNQQGADADVFKMVFDGYDFVFKALEDQGELSVIGAKLDEKNNIFLDYRFGFEPNGSISALFVKAGPAKSNDLANLPAIPFTIAADLQVDPALTEAMIPTLMSFVQIGLKQQQQDLTEEQIKQYQAAMQKSVESLRSGAFILGQAKSGESILDNVLYTLQTASAAQYLKISREQIEIMQKINAAAGQEMTVKESKVAGKEALEITQKGLLEQLKKQNPGNDREMNSIYNHLFGNRDSLQQWLVVADETTLVGTLNQALLLDTLGDLAKKKAEFGKDPENAAVLGLLPGERHATMLLDFGAYMNLIIKLQGLANGGNIPGNAIPEFPAAPAIGYSVKLSKEGLETSTAIPFKLISAGAAYFQSLVGNNGINF